MGWPTNTANQGVAWGNALSITEEASLFGGLTAPVLPDLYVN